MSSLPDDGGLGGYEPRFVDVHGLRTRYYQFGEGPPAVLIHGGVWGGRASANSWAAAFDALADRFEIYAFDRLGCGLTEAPADLDGLTYDDVVAHAQGFVDAVGLESYHLMGSSFGAAIAAVVGLEDPSTIRSLVLTNSGSLSPPVGDPRHRRQLLDRGLPEDEDVAAQARYQFETFSHRTEWLTDEFVEAIVAMDATEDAQRVRSGMEGERGESFQASFSSRMQEAHKAITDGELAVPTLLVWGRNDLTAPLPAARSLMDLLGQSETPVDLVVFNRAGHLPYAEYPEKFARTTRGLAEVYADR